MPDVNPSKTVIRLKSVGVKFSLSPEKEVSLKKEGLKALARMIRRQRTREFWALKEVELMVPRGEILGIIGANGAGKSTLLKIIAGIYPPSEGEVEVEGSIAPLIELGAAFNPELTGAENIFFVGSIYRIPRSKIRENFDRIVDFSGLRQFIHSPVKNYSSGMFLRLAFSMAIFFEPDIVLIDEVFAVGDEVFQQKSFEKILSFKERGATIVFVSHDLNLVQQICSRVVVLHRGKVHYVGETSEAVQVYHDHMSRGGGLEEKAELISREEGEGEIESAIVKDSRRWGSRQVEITGVSLLDENGKPKRVFAPGDYFEARLSYVSRLPLEAAPPVFGVAIYTIYKMLLYGPNTLSEQRRLKIGEKGVVRFIIPSLPLFAGDYLLSVAAYDENLRAAYDHHEMMYHFRVSETGSREFGCVRINHLWSVE